MAINTGSTAYTVYSVLVLHAGGVRVPVLVLSTYEYCNIIM